MTSSENIIGYDNVKRLFRMALDSNHRTSILLLGPSASAKTLFLQCLMQLDNSYFIDCGDNSFQTTLRRH